VRLTGEGLPFPAISERSPFAGDELSGIAKDSFELRRRLTAGGVSIDFNGSVPVCASRATDYVWLMAV
jgi:hypothetical protein